MTLRFGAICLSPRHQLNYRHRREDFVDREAAHCLGRAEQLVGSMV